MDAVVRWTLAQPGNENVRSVNALVGETNDGGAERHPRPARHARARARGDRRRATAGAVEEGAVGAGTGTIALRLERRHRHLVAQASTAAQGDTWTVGVLVQTNYGGKLDDRRRAGVEGARAGRADRCASASRADAPIAEPATAPA